MALGRVAGSRRPQGAFCGQGAVQDIKQPHNSILRAFKLFSRPGVPSIFAAEAPAADELSAPMSATMPAYSYRSDAGK